MLRNVYTPLSFIAICKISLSFIPQIFPEVKIRQQIYRNTHGSHFNQRQLWHNFSHFSSQLERHNHIREASQAQQALWSSCLDALSPYSQPTPSSSPWRAFRTAAVRWDIGSRHSYLTFQRACGKPCGLDRNCCQLGSIQRLEMDM